MDVFPLPSGASYQYGDTYTAAHHGSDVFASRGTPVVAVSPGHARADTDPLGGTVVYLTADDGWRYYYAHLDAVAPDLEAAGPGGLDVDSGALLGQIGTTGNAAGKSPHLHFQAAAPGAEEGTNPYPLLVAVDPAGQDLPDLGVHPLPPTLMPEEPQPTEAAAALCNTDARAIGMLALGWLLWRALQQNRRNPWRYRH